jgi:hypothetical protein
LYKNNQAKEEKMISLKNIQNIFKKERSAYSNLQACSKKQNVIVAKIKKLEAELAETKEQFGLELDNSSVLHCKYSDAVMETKRALTQYSNQEKPESDTADKQRFEYEILKTIREA